MNWTSKWEKAETFVLLFIKDKPIYCEVVGDLALDFDDEGWTIYHVPTLASFDSAVPANGLDVSVNEVGETAADEEYERQDLLNWMKKVQENYPTAWTMLRCLTPQDYADKGQSAKDIIQKWCLSVKVE